MKKIREMAADGLSERKTLFLSSDARSAKSEKKERRDLERAKPSEPAK